MESLKGVLRPGSKLKYNYKNLSDGLDLLQDIYDESIKVCFFDPQYRDKCITKTETGNGSSIVSLQSMNENVIAEFVKEIGRVLKPLGFLFLWVDDFNSYQLRKDVLENTDMKVVDLITWDKEKKEKRSSGRRSSEHLMVIQKQPTDLKENWFCYNIPDVWSEIIMEENHPHAKPVGLQMVLIEAITKENDFILDPAAGSYSVLKACKMVNRNFIGGDILNSEAQLN